MIDGFEINVCAAKYRYEMTLIAPTMRRKMLQYERHEEIMRLKELLWEFPLEICRRCSLCSACRTRLITNVQIRCGATGDIKILGIRVPLLCSFNRIRTQNEEQRKSLLWDKDVYLISLCHSFVILIVILIGSLFCCFQ